MNTYEIAEVIAELTAELARRGLADQSRIRFGNIRVATKNDGSPLTESVTVIYHGGKHIATISKHSNGTYRAHRPGYYAYPSHSKAQALANLLDNQTVHSERRS